MSTPAAALMVTGSLSGHLSQMIGDPATILFTAIRVAIVYLVLLLLLYLAGRRTLGQMTPFDLVVLLLVSNVVQNAMIGPDISLTGGLIGAATLIGLNHFVARNAWLRRHLERQPVMLVYRGRVLEDHLRREEVSLADLEEAIREHGIGSTADVETAVLEMDGTISIIGKHQAHPKKVRRVKSSRNR